MKNIIASFLLLIYSFIYSQTWTIKYNYEVRNAIFNDLFNFPATLTVDSKNQNLYTVQFGIIDQIQNNQRNTGGFSLIDKSSYQYVLFANSFSFFTIGDEINGSKYLFIDKIQPIEYETKNETKVIKNVNLVKAETEFRGRKYIIWYDPLSKIKGAPWKFTNLPGLAYEIYDDEKLFHWTLQEIRENVVEIKNPFMDGDVKNKSLPFTEYPKLKYPENIYIQNGVRNSNSMKKEQNRDGLEKIFEWEK